MNLNGELEQILSRNLALQLLVQGKYRWARLALVLAIVYFLVGFIIAALTQSLAMFLTARFVYVLLVAVVACVTAASWYPNALMDVIVAIPSALKVGSEAVIQIVREWMRLIRLPIPLTVGVLLAVFGVWLSFTQRQIIGLPAQLPSWMGVYATVLVAMCGLMLGGGVAVYLVTILLFQRLFCFELRLSHYRSLAPLSTFTAGQTILAFIAVALLLLLVFDEIRPASIAVIFIGLLGGGLMFVTLQYAYQGAVMRARRQYLDQLAPLYEKHYQVALQASADSEALQAAQTGLQALAAIEKNIESIPIYLIEVSDVIKVVWSSLAPILSLLIGPLLSGLGLS